MDLPQRKRNRLAQFDYSTPGAYFITICTQDRKNVLGHIVGGGAFDAPHIQLSPLGETTEKYLISGNRIPNVHVDKYVIMPNHLHFILLVDGVDENGASKAPPPTNAVIPHFVSTMKRFCFAEAGCKYLQRSYHDHVIRNQMDYLRIWEYIDTNPVKWKDDCFYEE